MKIVPGASKGMKTVEYYLLNSTSLDAKMVAPMKFKKTMEHHLKISCPYDVRE